MCPKAMKTATLDKSTSHFRWTVGASAAMWLTAVALPAIACVVPPGEYKPLDVHQFDTVIVGRVISTDHFAHPVRRAERMAWLKERPFTDPMTRWRLARRTDFARYTIAVTETIKGRVPPVVTADLRGALEPEEGSYLIALRPSDYAGIAGAGEYSVASFTCGFTHMFRSGSREANAIRESFGLVPTPPTEADRRTPERRANRLTWAVPLAVVVALGALAFLVARRRPGVRHD